ncbi:hypothetical protein GEMRC1_006948 [Eukaryota sp. GEM-RC1]
MNIVEDRSLYRSPCHMLQAACKFDTFLCSGQFSDVTIVVDIERYNVHRIILASYSDFFRALFQGPWRESSQSEVHLDWYDEYGIFPDVLKFLYINDIKLSADNVFTILLASTYFQIEALTLKCSEFMERSVSCEVAIPFIQVATKFHLSKVETRCLSILGEAFGSLVEEDPNAFNVLTLQQLTCLVDRELLYAKNELQIARVIANFCQHNNLSTQTMRELFSLVRWFQVSNDELFAFPKSCPFIPSEFFDPLIQSLPVPAPRFSCGARLDWTIPSFSSVSVKEIKSPLFEDVRGRRWQVVLYPKSTQRPQYTSVYLYAERSDGLDPSVCLEPEGSWFRYARFKVKVIDPQSGLRLWGYESVGHHFEKTDESDSLNWGWECFSEYDSMLQYLRNDVLYLRIVVASQEMFCDDD